MTIKMNPIPGLESAAREMGMTMDEAAEHFIRSEMPLRARKFFACRSPSRTRAGSGDNVVMFKRKQK